MVPRQCGARTARSSLRSAVRVPHFAARRVVRRNEFTVGAGAEWAVAYNWRLRGAYTYGDSNAFERNRFSLAAAYKF